MAQIDGQAGSHRNINNELVRDFMLLELNYAVLLSQRI
jgi:hypothetical protein